MSLIDPSTGEIVQQCTPEAARELTDQIRIAVEGTWELIKRAYETRAWASLGYSSWDDYLTREFGTTRLRLPREERQEVVASLRDSGLSVRAIAVATGEGVGTVHRALAGVPNGTPDEPAEPGPSANESPEVRDATGAPGAELQPRGEQANASPPRGAESGPGDAPGRSAKVTGTDGKRYRSQAPASPRASASQKVRDETREAPNEGVTEYLDSDQELRDAMYVGEFYKVLGRSDDFMEFDPERLAALADEKLLCTVDDYLTRVRNFAARLQNARPGLRVVKGQAR